MWRRTQGTPHPQQTSRLTPTMLSYNPLPKRADRTPRKIIKIFLPGWGFDGRILHLNSPPFSWAAPRGLLDPERVIPELLRLLERENSEKIELIGWSMGAHLALDFARAHPNLVAKLTLISLRTSWPEEEIRAIAADLASDREAFLANFYRKCFLGNKHALARFTKTLQPAYLHQASQEPEVLARGLSYLAQASTQEAPGVSTHLIHGGRDIISPPGQRARLANAAEEFIEGAGHLPFLSPECSLHIFRRKEIVREKFDKAAASYDAYAHIQGASAEILAKEAVDSVASRSKRILELGCGTGNYTLQLARNFPHARILAIDFAEEMLATARFKLRNFPQVTLLQADCEEFLNAGEQSRYHLITGNGTLQWFADLDAAIKNTAALLEPDGLFLATLFGPATFHELNLALDQINQPETSIPAATFPGAVPLEKIVRTYFESSEIKEKNIIKEYGTVRDLLTHIKKTGTVGWKERNTPVLTANRLRRLDRWFQQEYGGCRATYQILVVSARGPVLFRNRQEQG